MREIPLSQGQVALIDDEDFDRVAIYKWRAKKRKTKWQIDIHVRRKGKRIHVFLHHYINGYPIKPLQTDHIDGNSLNNQKSNLRFCTSSQNNMNRKKTERKKSSVFKGVHRSKTAQQWKAQICINRKYICIGNFMSERDAAVAYDKKAKELYKEFAVLNFPN